MNLLTRKEIEMDVKDLMIGDWIDDGYKKAQVTSITCDGIVETTAAISNIEVVDPIPLTEDILVKNGFASSEGYAYLHLDENNFLEFCYYNHRLSKIYMGIEIDDWDKRVKIRDVVFVSSCNYVHEFQHDLKRCGIEKEIVID